MHDQYKRKSGRGLLSLIIVSLLLKIVWNAFVPGLGGPILAFWQAMGIVVITRLLRASAACSYGEYRTGDNQHTKGSACQKGQWRAHFEAKWKEKHDNMSNSDQEPDIKPSARTQEDEEYKGGFTSGKWDVNVVDIETQEDTDGEQKASE